MKIVVRILLCTILFLSNQVVAQSSAAVFYGSHVSVPELCLYDDVIVDPYSDFNPKDYCNSLSQPFAYVSVGEVPKDSPYVKEIQKNWIIGNNLAWNDNFVIDQTNPAWQSFLMNQIIGPLWQKGYRGFFLDTLDSYLLAVHDPAAQQKQLDSIVSLIQQIKARYPQAKIILNRGFKLLPSVHSDIYAVLIESLYHAWHQNTRSYDPTPLKEQANLQAEIKTIKQMKLPIIIVDYLPPSQKGMAPALAKQIAGQGMIPWISNNQLDQIYIKKSYPVKREILVLFNSENNYPTRFHPSFRLLAALLEYMGYVPQYINLNETKILPKNLNNDYVGIILWLDVTNDKNKPLLKWAQNQIAKHIPLVFINSFGVPIESKELTNFGLSYATYKYSDVALRISQINHDAIGLEMRPQIDPYDFLPLTVNPGQVLLQMENEYQQKQDVVALTPWGGYALLPDVVFFMPNYYPYWIIDPIYFLKHALRLQDSPVPVATTENGLRLMTVHIDGDGFAYPSTWIGGAYAGSELLEKILKQYRIPTSVSVITGEIGPDGIHPKEAPELMATARKIFELPWVEIASHTFSHPFYWQSKTHEEFADIFGSEPFNINIPNYKFNLASEITGSVDFINKNLTPPNKKCKLFFWSGLGDPATEALKMTYDNGMLNINGGNDTYIDKQHPSITGIRPMGINIDGYYQVFAPIDLDFYYMNSLAGPLYGFEYVIQTLEMTNQPRRFKPIDLYFHFYSAGYIASLQSLNKVYRWALSQPVMNIFISDYIKKALDFYRLSISKDNSSWIFYTEGELRELRSVQSFGYPDLMNSNNVIGFNENKEGVYIHLGPNRTTILKYQSEKPTQPYLVDANARVTSFSRSGNQVVIAFQGYMPLKFTLANVGSCQVTAHNPLKVLTSQDKMTSYNSDKESDEVRINC